MAKKVKSSKKRKRNWNRILLISVICFLTLILTFQNRFFIYELAKHYYYKINPNPIEKFNKGAEISGLGIKLPADYTTFGVDVSRHQGIIDWTKLSNQYFGKHNFTFAFIKASEGGVWKDGMFRYNWERANETSLLVGAYHFYRPGIEPKKQIANFTSQVKLYSGHLPPVLDVEKISPSYSISRQREEILTILEGFKKQYNVTPIIYTNKQIYLNIINHVNFKRYPIWLAHYDGNVPNSNFKWKFWQLSERGIVDGVDEYVDINIFNGNIHDLRKLQIE